ncbi:MAG: HAD family hydrolase [Propionicimonas sp.]|uniref:HAD family hydrolase n=1 Tax=Propionicimonas sp. TaxID=1955623 RepID=UPI002B21E172|nr:HAD family hydrolase [Propionicimonas sp.]MEA4945461.1 HAD family hydrolase [Propionicimonas sp.]MEA5053039.1 HAD family hydrolase [Propionicimonas sp.]MEA5117432.1 HAD family hydrolase [Propionicimonas sp.]
MVKLVLTDMDGTLLHSDGYGVHPDLFATITELGRHGVRFAVASGRPAWNLRNLFAPILDEVTLICHNGALVLDSGTETICGELDPVLCEALLLEVAADDGIYAVVDAEQGSYIDQKGTEFLSWKDSGPYVHVVDDLMEVCRDRRILLVKMFGRNWSYPGSLVDIAARFSGRCRAARSGDTSIDFTDLNVSKGAAVATLQRRLGVTADETMVFGDNDNDLEMFAEARYAYAVANASEHVRAAAAAVIGSNDSDAVYHVLRDLLGGRPIPGGM